MYCVSTRGVTGQHKHRARLEYLRGVKQFAKKNPVLVGFGISKPAEGRRLAKEVDGIIVGSTLIEMIEERKSKTALVKRVREFKEAIM